MEKTKKSFKESLIEEEEYLKNAEKLDTEIIKEQEEVKLSEEEKFEQEFFQILEDETGLTKDRIDEWKEEYNDGVFVTRFREREIFVFRYVTHTEMKKMLHDLQNVSNEFKEERLDDMLFNKCVLYPPVTPDMKSLLGAGTVKTVAFQIKFSSNFIPEMAAIDLIHKL
jgi:hypothetical protein